jgi:hypothetical protein
MIEMMNNCKLRKPLIYVIAFAVLMSFLSFTGFATVYAENYSKYEGKGTNDFPYIINVNKDSDPLVDSEALKEIKKMNICVVYENENFIWKYKGTKIGNITEQQTNLLNVHVYNNEGKVYLDFAEKGKLNAIVTVKVFVGNFFKNADVVNIDYADGCSEIKADKYTYAHNGSAVDNGWISFDISCGGRYTVSNAVNDDGKTASVANNRLMAISRVYNKYKGEDNGSVDYPLTMQHGNSLIVLLGIRGMTFPHTAVSMLKT